MGREAQTSAIKLSAEGLTAQAIADNLNEKFGADLNENQVRMFLTRKKHKTFQVLKEDKNFQTKLAKQYFGTIDQMRDLNSEMWKFFYEVRKDPEFSSKQVFCPECNHKFRVQLKSFGTLLKTAEHLLKQIQHVDTVLGKLQNKSLNITYNYVDLSKKLTQVMPQMFARAERQGLIKIKNRKMTKFNQEDL